MYVSYLPTLDELLLLLCCLKLSLMTIFLINDVLINIISTQMYLSI